MLVLPMVLAAQRSPGQHCVVDVDTAAVPACALETRHGSVHVIAAHVPALFADTTQRLTAVFLPTGWAYIDRRGRIVVDDVAVMDNGANEFHHGLVRVTRGGRWGLADMHGRLVVPFEYDGMLDYQPGKGWPVCKQCRAATDGEHGWFAGGQWSSLDQRGRPAR